MKLNLPKEVMNDARRLWQTGTFKNFTAALMQAISNAEKSGGDDKNSIENHPGDGRIVPFLPPRD